MRDQFDVQLGVARPVEPGARASLEAEDGAVRPNGEPIAEVGHRNRGIPLYLMPSLLIVMAAVGIMSYQSLMSPDPLSKASAPRGGEPGPLVTQGEDRPSPRAGRARTAIAAESVSPNQGPTSTAPTRPPIPTLDRATLELVETSAAQPVIPPETAAKPITDASSLFDHECAAGLRPVVDGKPAEPPLVSPGPER